MNKVLLILCLVFLVSCSPKEVPYDQLVERQGIKYEVNSTTPFTGVVVDYHKNGQLEYKGNYKEGEKDGLEEWYYENGELLMKDNYKKGKLQGVDFDQLVKRQSVVYEVNSTTPFTGRAVSYYDNGQLSWRKDYKDGKLDGRFERYLESGQFFFKENYKGGSLVDGLQKAFPKWNSQLKFKSNYKDGKLDGLFELYYENGPLRSNPTRCYDNGEEIDMSYCK